MGLRERLASMNAEELREVLRATGDGDRTHAAAHLASINDDRGEVLDILLHELGPRLENILPKKEK